MKSVYATMVLEIPFNLGGQLVLQERHMTVRGLMGVYGQLEVLGVMDATLSIPAAALSNGERKQALHALFQQVSVEQLWIV